MNRAPVFWPVSLVGVPLVMLSLAVDGTAIADPGQPVAIVRQPGGWAIESMWNLRLRIVTDAVRPSETEGVDVIRAATAADTDGSTSGRIRVPVPPGTTLDHTLDRAANSDRASWAPTSQVDTPTSNAIRVRAHGSAIVVEVDGVRITYLDPDAGELDAETRSITEETDVLILGGSSASAGEAAESIAAQRVLSDVLVVAAEDQDASGGNTLAVQSEAIAGVKPRRTVRLHDRPAQLSAELEALMRAKEASCAESQEVFAPLSAEQMNFRPANGTHTPRWNAEHMMGRELLFFSQIYSAQDPAIPVMDLNPAQMPPDYRARHPQWSGREEARQMQRVSAFTRRFAYLLKDLPLDQPAPASRWTPQALLRQMDRHYREHTANVVKKFDLPEWPAE